MQYQPSCAPSGRKNTAPAMLPVSCRGACSVRPVLSAAGASARVPTHSPSTVVTAVPGQPAHQQGSALAQQHAAAVPGQHRRRAPVPPCRGHPAAGAVHGAHHPGQPPLLIQHRGTGGVLPRQGHGPFRLAGDDPDRCPAAGFGAGRTFQQGAQGLVFGFQRRRSGHGGVQDGAAPPQRLQPAGVPGHKMLGQQGVRPGRDLGQHRPYRAQPVPQAPSRRRQQQYRPQHRQPPTSLPPAPPSPGEIQSVPHGVSLRSTVLLSSICPQGGC